MKKSETKDKKKKPKEVQALAKRIKHFRIKAGYTSQESFANDNDYTMSYYSRIERGEDIRYTSLIKVLKALRVDLKEFFSEGFEKIK